MSRCACSVFKSSFTYLHIPTHVLFRIFPKIKSNLHRRILKHAGVTSFVYQNPAQCLFQNHMVTAGQQAFHSSSRYALLPHKWISLICLGVNNDYAGCTTLATVLFLVGVKVPAWHSHVVVVSKDQQCQSPDRHLQTNL